MIGLLEPSVLIACAALVLALVLSFDRVRSSPRDENDAAARARYHRLLLDILFWLALAAWLAGMFAVLSMWPRVSGAMCAQGLLVAPVADVMPMLFALVLTASTRMGATLFSIAGRAVPAWMHSRLFWVWATAAFAACAFFTTRFFATRVLGASGTCCSTTRVSAQLLHEGATGANVLLFVGIAALGGVSVIALWFARSRILANWLVLLFATGYPFAFARMSAPHLAEDPFSTCLYCALEHANWLWLPALAIPLAAYFVQRSAEHLYHRIGASIAMSIGIGALLAPVASYWFRNGTWVFGG